MLLLPGHDNFDTKCLMPKSNEASFTEAREDKLCKVVRDVMSGIEKREETGPGDMPRLPFCCGAERVMMSDEIFFTVGVLGLRRVTT